MSPIENRLNSLAFGLTLPFKALRLIIGHPALLFWSSLPVALAITLYVLVIAKLQAWIHVLLQSLLLAWGWDPNGFVAGLFSFLIPVALIFVGALTFSFGVAVISAPFNDILAEKSESRSTPPLAMPDGQRSILSHLRMIWIDVLKSLFSLAVFLFALALSVLPGANIGGLLISFFALTFQYISYPQTRRGQGIRAGALFLTQHPFASLGFGATLFFLLSIPIISIIALPMGVVGGTLLFARAQPENGIPKLQ